MSKSTSIFLDALRVLAALTVFVAHCSYLLYGSQVWKSGHAAVILFFVLSGYVIAYSALRKGKVSVRHYVVARLARLYSVVIPALLLTAILMVIGWVVNPAFYGQMTRDWEPWRYVATGCFLQSLWGFNLYPNSNGPIWSLGYEFWYYGFFAILLFVRGWKRKAALLLLGAVIVGENILLLFPIWLLGAALYRGGETIRISRPKAIVAWSAVSFLAVVSIVFMPEFPRQPPAPPLYYSAAYVTDWILGLEFGAIIWFYAQASRDLQYPDFMARAIRWAADRTFSLYLFHFPLLFFVSATHLFDPQVWWQAALGIGLVLLVIVALSSFTESKRELWRKAIDRVWDWAARRLAKRFA